MSNLNWCRNCRRKNILFEGISNSFLWIVLHNWKQIISFSPLTANLQPCLLQARCQLPRGADSQRLSDLSTTPQPQLLTLSSVSSLYSVTHLQISMSKIYVGTCLFLAVPRQLYRFPCHWLTDSLTHWLTDSLTHWLTDWLTACFEKHYQRALWETCDLWDMLS